MNTGFTPKTNYPGESKTAAAKPESTRLTLANTLLATGLKALAYIRFQCAFSHPRNWRRYTLVTSGEVIRHTDVKYHGRLLGMEMYSSPSVSEGSLDTIDPGAPEAVQARTNFFAAQYLKART